MNETLNFEGCTSTLMVVRHLLPAIHCIVNSLDHIYATLPLTILGHSSRSRLSKNSSSDDSCVGNSSRTNLSAGLKANHFCEYWLKLSNDNTNACLPARDIHWLIMPYDQKYAYDALMY